jgi:hypothetical protein
VFSAPFFRCFAPSTEIAVKVQERVRKLAAFVGYGLVQYFAGNVPAFVQQFLNPCGGLFPAYNYVIFCVERGITATNGYTRFTEPCGKRMKNKALKIVVLASQTLIILPEFISGKMRNTQNFFRNFVY